MEPIGCFETSVTTDLRCGSFQKREDLKKDLGSGRTQHVWSEVALAATPPGALLREGRRVNASRTFGQKVGVMSAETVVGQPCV